MLIDFQARKSGVVEEFVGLDVDWRLEVSERAEAPFGVVGGPEFGAWWGCFLVISYSCGNVHAISVKRVCFT